MKTLATPSVLVSLALGLLEESDEAVRFRSQIEKLAPESLEHVIQRLIVREGFKEEDARALRVEYLRFMTLRFFTNDRLSPSPWVDQFWHAHILFTKDYHRFCQEHFGFYVHHEPQDHSKTKAVRDGTPGMRTKELIERLYPTHNKEVWAQTAICSNNHCDGIRA